MKIETTLRIEKITKGAVRYSDQAGDFPKIIYLRKDELPATPPQTIALTLEWS